MAEENGLDELAFWKYRNYRAFMTVRLSLTMAYQMLGVVTGWQLYQITKDPFSLGLMGLFEAIPAIGLALIGGYIADLYRRNLIAGLGCVLILGGASMQFLATQGVLPLVPALLYASTFLSGMARALISPSNQALLSQVVKTRAELPKAAAWNSTVWQIGSISGPLLAGLLYPIINASGVYMIVVGLTIITITSYIIMQVEAPPREKKEPILKSLAEGISFVRQSPRILSVLSLDMFAVLFGGAVALLPAFAEEILAVGPEGLGILRASSSIGAAFTALIMGFTRLGKNAGKVLMACVFGYGLTTIGFGLSTNFWLSLIMLFVGGMLDGVSVVIRSTILQLATPDAMRGRVSAINTLFVGSSNEIGALESGTAAKVMGLVPSVVFGGAMCCAIVLGIGWKYPYLYRLNMNKLV